MRKLLSRCPFCRARPVVSSPAAQYNATIVGSRQSADMEFFPAADLDHIDPSCKKIIVGIDFGHAYSGVTIMYKDVPDEATPSAPTGNLVNPKVPTALMFDEFENTWYVGGTFRYYIIPW